MSILEASTGANEHQVFQSNCLYECFFAGLEEYEDERVQEAVIKEKDKKLSLENKCNANKKSWTSNKQGIGPTEGKLQYFTRWNR